MHDRVIIQNGLCTGETITAPAACVSDDNQRRYLEEQLPGGLERRRFSGRHPVVSSIGDFLWRGGTGVG